MKTLFTLLLFLFILVSVFAQPMITSDGVRPQVGDEYTGVFFFVNSEDYSPGEAGANQIYDFSGLRDSVENDLQQYIDTLIANPVFTFKVLAAEDILNSDSFPNADFAILTEIDFFGYNGNYAFIEEQANGFFDLGGVNITNIDLFGIEIMDTTTTVNTEEMLLLPTPFTFNDSYVNTSTSLELDLFAPGFLNQETVTDSIVVDGYGTLLSPVGTIENVLRVITYSEITTTQIEEVTGMEVSSETESEVTYSWFANTQLAPVAQFIVDEEDPTVNIVNFFVPNDFTITNTGAQRLKTISMTVSPNPILDHALVSFQLPASTQSLQLSLYTLNGQLVQQSRKSHFPQGLQRLPLQIPSQISDGIYILELKSVDFTARTKIMLR